MRVLRRLRSFVWGLASLRAACGVLVLLAPGCAKRAESQAVRPPTLVQTALAVALDAPVIINTFGTTEDRESVDVMPQVAGMLSKTFIRDGATVTNGQPLFQIDPSDYALRVGQAEGLVAVDRAQLELHRISLERNRTLFAQKLVAPEVFDTVKTGVDAADAQLRIDQATLELARLNLSRCTITATVAGVCSSCLLDNGNIVEANKTKLTNIRSYDPMDVEFSVSEEYLPLVRHALAAGPVPIEVMPRGDTNTYTGALVFVDNAVNTGTGTILLRGQVPNPELRLWARQFVTVRVVAGMVRAAVMAPESAVQLGKRGPYVFVAATNGTADLRLVTTGVRYHDLIQITSGAAPGERLVVLGQMLLYPGAPVAEAPGGAASGGTPGGAAGRGGK